MTRYLLWLILAWLVWRWVLVPRRRVSGPASAAQTPLDRTEEMVRCRHCGLFLPRAEAFCAGSDCYCSAEHQTRGPV